MMTKKFVWNRDTVVDVCFSLTNYHLRLHPMREEDIMGQTHQSGAAFRYGRLPITHILVVGVPNLASPPPY